MFQLTDRQITILKAVIEEYIETAEPVGSETLDKKYNLGVSPATIRNEMVRLTEQKMLKQPHTSAGRIPTPMALKFYIQNLMKQQDLPVSDEVAVKQKIWDYREKAHQALREATKALAEKTHTLAVSTTSDGDMYYAGAAYLLDTLEFYDMITTKNLLHVLDESDFWQNVFEEREEARFHVIFGEDLKQQYLENLGMVYAVVHSPKFEFSIGVVGPCRLHFESIIPVVSYFGNLMGEISRKWY